MTDFAKIWYFGALVRGDYEICGIVEFAAVALWAT